MGTTDEGIELQELTNGTGQLQGVEGSGDLPLSPQRTESAYLRMRAKPPHEHALIRLEVLSSASTQRLFRMINAAVLVCVGISVLDYWCMWECDNVCSTGSCTAPSASGGCFSLSGTRNGSTVATWHGSVRGLSRLNRFVHITIAVDNPLHSNASDENGAQLWDLTVLQRARDVSGNVLETEHVTTLGCAARRQCSASPVPAVAELSTERVFEFNVTFVDPPKKLVPLLATTVLTLEYQSRIYTMIELGVRHLLMAAALWRLLWVCCWLCALPRERRLAEQLYLPAMLVFLVLYLDPCSAAATLHPPSARMLVVRFVEFHCNFYATIFMQGFYVVLMRCSARDDKTAGTAEACVFALWFGSMAAVDTVVALHTSNARSDYSSTFFVWVFDHAVGENRILATVLFATGMLLQAAWLVAAIVCTRRARKWLRDQPWFETRHRQLSFRYILFLTVAFVLYRIVSSGLNWASHGGFSVPYRSSQELGAVAITFVFAYTIAHIFSPHVPTSQSPPAPGDPSWAAPRWKKEAWPPEWYSWLARYGGGLYYFVTEQEQAEFLRIQDRAALRYALRCRRPCEVHAQPAARAPVVGHLSDGAEVVVTAERGGWLHLRAGGWVHRFGGQWQKLQGEHSSREARTAADVTWLPWRSWTGRARRGAARPFFCLESCADMLELSARVYFPPGPEEGPLAHPAPELACGDFGLRVTVELHPYAVAAVAATIAARIVGPGTPRSAVALRVLSSPPGRASVSPRRPDDEGRRTARVAAHGHHLYDHFEFAGTQVFLVLLGRDPRRLCIAFRGTDNSANLQADFQASRVPWAEMGPARGCTSCLCPCGAAPLVHRGFHDMWELPGGVAQSAGRPGSSSFERRRRPSRRGAVWYERMSLRDCVLMAVDGAMERLADAHGGMQPRLYATGHSLGGALACLCAYTLKQRRGWEPVVYTFGAPVLGNAAFRADYDSAVPGTFRVVNERDIVVHGAVTCANEHIGKEVCINRRGRLLVEPSWVEKTFQPTKDGARVQSHSLASHSESLNRALEAAGLARRCRCDFKSALELFVAEIKRAWSAKRAIAAEHAPAGTEVTV